MDTARKTGIDGANTTSKRAVVQEKKKITKLLQKVKQKVKEKKKKQIIDKKLAYQQNKVSKEQMT